MAERNQAVDGLAYAANTAATISGGQLARGTRKSARSGATSAASAGYQKKFGYRPPDGMSPAAMRRWTKSSIKTAPGATGDPVYERVVKKLEAGASPDQAVADAKTLAGAQKTRSTRKSAKATPVAVRPATPAPLLSRANVRLAQANPFIMATAGLVSASTAYQTAIASGATTMQAAGASAVAAAPLAAAALAPTLIGRAAPKVGAVISKAALPLLGLSLAIAAARGGYQAAQAGKGIGGIAGGAVMGAADSLTFGLASKGVDAVADLGRAYASNNAMKAAQSPAPPRVVSPSLRPVAQPNSSDGQTASYTRVDSRTGAVVKVQSYKTPKAA